MESAEKEVRKTLKKHLQGVASSTLESLARRIGSLPGERILVTTDIGVALAASNLRVAVEMLRAAPEVSVLISAGDLRVWGEIGKRFAATSADTSINFFQISSENLATISDDKRTALLRLINKQAALSAGTALETFKAAPTILNSISDPEIATRLLNVAVELSRHSVKHSSDLFNASPEVIRRLPNSDTEEGKALIDRALSLTSNFAFRSGGTAAEFFIDLPAVAAASSADDLKKLFTKTEEYLERSGGVALQYFKAASRVLTIAGRQSFDRWSGLAQRVSLQGNAASYHFMKASPQIITDLATRAGPKRSGQVVAAVLEVIDEVAAQNTLAGVACFKASALALTSASLGQFRDWALKGLEQVNDSSRRIQAYYSLESKASQEALFRIEGGLTLDSVAQTLRLYVEGLTGRSLNVAPLSSIPDESRIGDGKTIYLPSVVAEFEHEAENFRLFKVLAAHAAGQVEFKTFSAEGDELLAAFTATRASFEKPDETPKKKGRTRKPRQPTEVGFLSVVALYPNTELALRLFTTIENGRIDYLLRRTYRGIRRDLDFVRMRLSERRPALDKIPEQLMGIELLFQAAICGGISDQARRAFPVVTGKIERILDDYILSGDPTVADSLMATRTIYDLFTEQPGHGDTSNENSSGDEDQQQQEGGEDEAPGDSSSESSQKSNELREDLMNLWSAGQLEQVSPDAELFNQITGGESPEQDLEKGDRAFYYDEWDRELGDYRTRWCRVIERSGARGSRGFVELVRSRFAGIISSIRYQFQLLRPENLRKIRGEVDGEDYDLQSVIDYALDKRSTGIIDDRLYTRKLRRQRDVAVSFLLDMSSSTARTISRFPSHPYTQPGQRIIDIEKEGLVLMSEALEAVGDAYSMQGFTSEGRRNVKFYIIKDFDEGYSTEVERRIGGITYQNNTRLGAAIRHAITRLTDQEARTKLLIVLSDGRPYDHDYGDSRYAREDTRMALRQARVQGITPFCITIDRESEDQLRDMYGEVGYTIIDDVLHLPERLPGIYSRLTT